ncbi:hypothetical protein ACOMHN_063729 [Nucella lapillus]
MLVRLIVSLALSQHLLCAGIRSVCHDEMPPQFRCYNLWPPYTNTNFHLPASPSAQKIQFQLFTVHNRHTPDLLNPASTSSFHNSHFDPHLDTKAVNVIVVDWSEGAKGPNYYQAAANCRVVGAHIASLIQTAELLGSSASRFHVIGHSLGAQIGGYAGSYLSGRLGRISGLDPAAPKFENYANKVKLEKTDAQFVDIMHTDAQPLHEAALGDDIGCSHNRAPHYYVASINDNDFRSYPCGSADGNCHVCGSGCANMGYHAIPDFSGLYVTTTQAEYPY